ncbi:MAG: leucyl/phenylalanyl-tRNA--protein transferase [Planctomycetota bacterium]|nr:leucyl/phenylalanyl-tRNA--protein transferase [Planctomycetota bacterium]MCX8040305.1 leucyl/phenylalanyl-tRNA--protein transferase [Planctomycetota bacterium]MDW8372400.1 leucyl/phenylalanyl-tRNA--protein transferase [Planctomycetota bacterium]
MAEPADIRDLDGYPVTPDTVLAAYRLRCFPMCEHRAAPIAWYRPLRRAIITWDRYRVPRSLAKVLRNRRPFRLTVDRDFAAVIAACAERPDTWIGRDIEALYCELHRRGHAHSVEAWDGDGKLVGGLYGLAVGGCFSGESMFHRVDDAAKACVVHLVALLQDLGYSVLDCQQQSAHMARFGAYEVSDAEYARLLAEAPPPRPWPRAG